MEEGLSLMVLLFARAAGGTPVDGVETFDGTMVG
jgi:hypothetical protein